MKGNLREADLVARFGGDEFAILISCAETSALVGDLAAKLVGVLAAPFHIQDRVIRASASLGVEMYGPDAPDVQTLLLHADIGLYRVKADGGGSYRIFAKDLGLETRAPVRTARRFVERLPSAAAAA